MHGISRTLRLAQTRTRTLTRISSQSITTTSRTDHHSQYSSRIWTTIPPSRQHIHKSPMSTKSNPTQTATPASPAVTPSAASNSPSPAQPLTAPDPSRLNQPHSGQQPQPPMAGTPGPGRGGSTASAQASAPETETETEPTPAQAQAKQLPLLPGPESSPSDGSTRTTTITVDGAAIPLDHLGPMVVGVDGTVSRVANWGEMTEHERRNTLRVLGRRNKARLEALRGQGGEE